MERVWDVLPIGIGVIGVVTLMLGHYPEKSGGNMHMKWKKRVIECLMVAVFVVVSAGCSIQTGENVGERAGNELAAAREGSRNDTGKKPVDVNIETTESVGEETDDKTWDVRPIPELPASGSRLADFIPQDWELMDSVELDYNEDGITDYVGVLEHMWEEDGGVYMLSPRILFAVYSEGEERYCLDFWDVNLIRARSEGGIFGDPYLPLTAEGKSFTTHAYGGSAWKWSEDYTYTCEDGTWYLTASEEIYGYGFYVTDYSENDYLKGIGIVKKRSSDFDDMERNYNNPRYENGEDYPYDVIYQVPLDSPVTLSQASARWWLAADRMTDFPVTSVEIAEGVEITEDRIRFPGDVSSFDSCNEEGQMLYTFWDADTGRSYLALYCRKEQTLSVLEEILGLDKMVIYKDKIYYTVDVNEMVSYRLNTDGEEEIVRSEETVGVRLYRMNLDGSNREKVFEYYLPGMEQEVLDKCPHYLSLLYEISGDEIVVEIYGGAIHPFYRMKSDGSQIEYIGGVPSVKFTERA